MNSLDPGYYACVGLAHCTQRQSDASIEGRLAKSVGSRSDEPPWKGMKFEPCGIASQHPGLAPWEAEVRWP
jgi:hypothetical protein